MRGRLPSITRLIPNCLFMLTLLHVPQAAADAPEAPEAKFLPEAAEAADLRGRRIQAELAELAGRHDWAGSYYSGDGLGVNVSLMLSPQSGYVFEWRGCLGVYDRNYGNVDVVDGKLRLSFTFPNKQEGFGGIPGKFVAVAWGERRYLVPADDMAGFCNEINSGAEPRDEAHGMYLLRRGDEKIEVTGRPRLPEEFVPYLLDRPLEARIVAVKNTTTRPGIADWRFRDTLVIVSAGKKHRVFPGMELHVVAPANMVEWATVTKVGENTAEAVITQNRDNEPVPRVGWKLSSRPSYRGGLSSLLEIDASTDDKPGASRPAPAEDQQPRAAD